MGIDSIHVQHLPVTEKYMGSIILDFGIRILDYDQQHPKIRPTADDGKHHSFCCIKEQMHVLFSLFNPKSEIPTPKFN